MTQKVYTGSTQARDALLNYIQVNTAELYLTKAELEAARGGEASLSEKINNIEQDLITVTLEVTDARDGESTLLDQVNDLQTGILSIANEIIAARDGETTLIDQINKIQQNVDNVTLEVISARDGESSLLAQVDSLQSYIADVLNEVVAARDGEATLLDQIDDIQSNISGIIVGGVPSLAGNAGKPLVVNEAEDDVEWGEVGPQDLTLSFNESVKIATNATDKKITILNAASNIFSTSTDGVNWTDHPDAAWEIVDGDFYVGGPQVIPIINALESMDNVVLDPTFYLAYRKDDFLFAWTGGKGVRKYSWPSLTLLQTKLVDEYPVGFIFRSNDLFVVNTDTNNNTSKAHVFADGNLSATPVVYDFSALFGGTLLSLAFYQSNIIALEAASSTQLRVNIMDSTGQSILSSFDPGITPRAASGASLMVDAEGDMYISTKDEGIYKFSGITPNLLAFRKKAELGNNTSYLYQIFEYDGDIWAFHRENSPYASYLFKLDPEIKSSVVVFGA